MTTAIDHSDQYALASEIAGFVRQSREDFARLSNLHPDFVEACLAALDAKKKDLCDPVLSWEVVPYLVARSLELDDKSRRAVAAACVALSGYVYILDGELDKKGYLGARLSIAASALLGWAVATVSHYAAGTPFASVFLDNINRAFAGQYEDMKVRGDAVGDRRRSDVEKNRGYVAAVAGFCAIGSDPDDRLIRMVEALIGPMQIWDDFQDIEEDYREENLTPFVSIYKECVDASQALLGSEEMYDVLIRDPRTTALLKSAQSGLEQALVLLDANRDQSLIAYIGELSNRNTALISALEDFQHDPPLVAASFVIRRLRRIVEIGTGS
jgi:hypothetical protein